MGHPGSNTGELSGFVYGRSGSVVDGPESFSARQTGLLMIGQLSPKAYDPGAIIVLCQYKCRLMGYIYFFYMSHLPFDSETVQGVGCQ